MIKNIVIPNINGMTFYWTEIILNRNTAHFKEYVTLHGKMYINVYLLNGQKLTNTNGWLMACKAVKRFPVTF